MSDDSSSLNEFAEYLNNEGCDGKRFADFVLKKAGGNRPHRIFPEVLSDSDSISFNVQLEKIITPPVENVPTQEEPLSAAAVEKEIVHDVQSSAAQQHVHNVHSPTKKSGGRPNSDHLRRYSLKRLSSVRQRRQLLKEFESTLQDTDFDPQICSTPMNTRQENENIQNRFPVNEKKSDSNCHASPIIERVHTMPSQMNISISDSRQCCLHRNNDEQKNMLNEPINAQQDSNKNYCPNCSNKSIPTESPTLQRIYNIEKGKNPGEIILSPVSAALQESQAQENHTKNSFTVMSTRSETKNNTQPDRTYNLSLRTRESKIVQESKNLTIDKENNSNIRRNIPDGVQNIVHLNNSKESLMPHHQNIVEQNLEEEVIPEIQDCENRARNISTGKQNNANVINTLNHSSILSQRNKDNTTLKKTVIRQTRNTARNLSKASSVDSNMSEHINVVNKSSVGSRRYKNGSIQNINTNEKTQCGSANVEYANVLERNSLNNLLTDDESETSDEQEAYYKKDNSNAPLNLASRKLRSRYATKTKQLHVGIPIAHPLKLEVKKSKTQSRKQKIPLNKAPNSPINGEKFADEIKSQLVRLTNMEILDLRMRNSLGKVYASNGTNLAKQQELNEKQHLLEEEIQNELKNRSLHRVSNEHSRHILSTTLAEQSKIFVELFSVPDVFKDVHTQDKNMPIPNTQKHNIVRRTSQKALQTRNSALSNNVDKQYKDNPLLNADELDNLCTQEEIVIPDTQNREGLSLRADDMADLCTQENNTEIVVPDTQNRDGPSLRADDLADLCTRKNNTEIVIPDTQNRDGPSLRADDLADLCTQEDNPEIVVPDTQNRDDPSLHANDLEDLCTQQDNNEIVVSDTQNKEDLCMQEDNTEMLTGEKVVLNGDEVINANTQDKTRSSSIKILENVSLQNDIHEFLTGNPADLHQISFARVSQNETTSKSTKGTKKNKNKKRQIPEEVRDYMTLKERIKKKPKTSLSKRSLYSKGLSDSETSNILSSQDDSFGYPSTPSKSQHKSTNKILTVLTPPPPSLENAAGSVPKSTTNDDEIFRKPVAPAPKAKSRKRKPVEKLTNESTSENDQILRRSKRGHVPLKTVTPYVHMFREMMEKSELAKIKRLNTTKKNAQKTAAYSSAYSMNSNDSVPIASSTVKTTTTRTKNPKKQQTKQNQPHTPNLLGDATNVNSTTGESTQSRNMQLTPLLSEPHRVLLDDEYPTSSTDIRNSNQVEKNTSLIFESPNESQPMTPTLTKNSKEKERMPPLKQISEKQPSACLTAAEENKSKAKSAKNKKPKVNVNKKIIERSHIEFNPVPVNELNNIFDRLKHESTVESEIKSQVKKCMVRMKRLKLPVTECTPISQSVPSTVEQSNIAVTASSDETPNEYSQSDGELLSWLKGFKDIGNPSGYEKIFTEMHCSAAGNLMFTDLEGIDYAFYDTEDKASLGYLRFKPRQIKPLKRAKRFHLHFIVLSGKFKISTNKDQGEFKMGDMIAINIGTRYEIVNDADDIGILMVIKK